jgi:hypothetical protein
VWLRKLLEGCERALLSLEGVDRYQTQDLRADLEALAAQIRADLGRLGQSVSGN